ncbi:hypothetical protein QN277_015722 [Acacia crassicarpa]|uniref:Prephenate/arogenate dehydrogenase domain-containing protein n=1 Tax=Acacia crassicarpa TaxID=499986 RepID=A0AAE1KKP0_9FABA|nr:hypothetical protein QN277_015722 [Acacia crassicarpa]
MKIGIVGFGNFAQFLAKAFIRQGHTLCATSRSDYSLHCSELGIHFFRDVTALFDADNDVVLISTSILSLSEVLRSLPLDRLKRPVLFVDVLSVKEYPRQALLEVLPEESDILCTHPMFGPQGAKDGWRGHNFMYEKVRIRNEGTCSNFLQIFASEGCTMLEMSCEEHDKLAAKTQFITHTVGRTLGELEITSTPIDTKSFQTLLQTKETMMRNSFDLFYGLFIHNRFARQELENLENALRKVKETLIQKANEEKEKTQC